MSYFVRFLLLCCTVALAIPTYANALNERDAVVSRQTGKLQIRVHYPITGNARVDADVADWAHQAVDTFQNTYGEEPDLGVPYELETTYSTTRSTPSVLSIVWKTASYTGGAHGNLEITTTTYDMKSGALIDLYDVFENLDTALDVMSRYCTKALTKSLGVQRRHAPQRHRPRSRKLFQLCAHARGHTHFLPAVSGGSVGRRVAGRGHPPRRAG